MQCKIVSGVLTVYLKLKTEIMLTFPFFSMMTVMIKNKGDGSRQLYEGTTNTLWNIESKGSYRV